MWAYCVLSQVAEIVQISVKDKHQSLFIYWAIKTHSCTQKHLKLVGKYSNYSTNNKDLYKKTAINHFYYTKKHSHNNKNRDRGTDAIEGTGDWHPM